MPASNQQPQRTEQFFWAPPELPWLELRTSLESRLPYAAHFHPGLSVGLILEGRTAFSCPAESHLAEAGDVVLVEPELPHSCNPLDGLARSYHMLYFDAAWCRARGLLPEGEIRLRRRVVQDPALYDALRALADLVATGRAGPELEDRFLALLPALLRDNLLPAEGKAEAVLRRRNALRRESFIRAFRRASGLTPGRYAQVRRLEAARAMLRSGAEISEAALASGYADQSHLHRAFVRYFAATPRQYRSNRSLSSKK